jgi:hypothetical protein
VGQEAQAERTAAGVSEAAARDARLEADVLRRSSLSSQIKLMALEDAQRLEEQTRAARVKADLLERDRPANDRVVATAEETHTEAMAGEAL